MKLFLGLLLSSVVLCCACVCAADEVRLPDQLPAHPRLFLTPAREAEIKLQRATDPFLAKLVDELIVKADRAKNEPVTDYKIPDGKRLLAQSRRSLDRTSALAFAYRMTGDGDYATKAIDEMLAVCRFKDWNPSHYLDTAEMATAVAIGYDWLFSVIPAGDRDEIRAALIKHALQTGLPIYKQKRWWVASHNNWNEVCNAGLTIAAIAIAEDEPEMAIQIVEYALKSLPNGLAAYKPDGAYPEGPSYWNYGASFTGLMLRAVGDVFGNGFAPLQELLAAPGLSTTGDYVMSVVGPLERTFNYADGGDGMEGSPMMFALTSWYRRPEYAVWLREFLQRRGRYAAGRLAVFHAIWYTPAGTAADFSATPLAKICRGVQDICMMRTAWNDPTAAFLGFKAGDNRANHGHLDVGSFIYDARGVRWVVDLGTDDYNLPGYFGKQRWSYFRLNNHSHNTLVIGDQLQTPTAVCPLVEFETDSEADGDNFVARAVADMTPAYAGQASSVRRTATLRRDGSVVIDDVLTGVTEKVRWAMVTAAKVDIDARRAVLTQDNKTLTVELDSPNTATWCIISAQPPTPKERQNEGFTILAAFAEPQDGNVTLRVTLTPSE